MSPTSIEVARAASRVGSELTSVASELKEATARLDASRRSVAEARAAAAAELGAALLPALDPGALAAAANLTGHLALVNEDPIGAMQRERVALERRIVEIEREPDYADRELLRAPGSGTLTREEARLRYLSQELEVELARFEHPRLGRLVNVDYGLETYDVPWWRVSYYGDWKAGDEILERFPDMQTFAEVRSEYTRFLASMEDTGSRLAAIVTQIEAGAALEREMDGAREALATLETRHLAAAREGLVTHLLELDLESAGLRLGSDERLAPLVKRVSGLAHKERYLDEVAAKQLADIAQDLETERTKLGRTAEKYRRPKMAGATLPVETFRSRFEGRSERYRRRLERSDRYRQTIDGFDDYDRGRFANDFLWWDVMTDGRLDGDFIDDVATFRRDHPGYRYERFGHLDDDAAAAALDADRTRNLGTDIS